MNGMTKEEKRSFDWFVCFVVGFTCFFAGRIHGGIREESKQQQYAVEKGHAIYKLNEKHERVWEWLPPCHK